MPISETLANLQQTYLTWV